MTKESRKILPFGDDRDPRCANTKRAATLAVVGRRSARPFNLPNDIAVGIALSCPFISATSVTKPSISAKAARQPAASESPFDFLCRTIVGKLHTADIRGEP
jgi:hypothetical protein